MFISFVVDDTAATKWPKSWLNWIRDDFQIVVTLLCRKQMLRPFSSSPISQNRSCFPKKVYVLSSLTQISMWQIAQNLECPIIIIWAHWSDSAWKWFLIGRMKIKENSSLPQKPIFATQLRHCHSKKKSFNNLLNWNAQWALDKNGHVFVRSLFESFENWITQWEWPARALQTIKTAKLSQGKMQLAKVEKNGFH